MREYQKLLDKYSLEGSGWFSKLTPESEWGDKEIAQKYLEKFWLPEAEYESIWKPIQNQIFTNQDKSLPEMMFKDNLKLIASKGGCLFLKEDFEQLQQCFLKVGDKYFVVIENTFGNRLQEPHFQMKYSTTINWEELVSGNFISSTIVEDIYKEYFVFGDSGVWGKYSANDYQRPLDIIGFQLEYQDIFIEKLQLTDNNFKDIIEWLPPAYRERIKF